MAGEGLGGGLGGGGGIAKLNRIEPHNICGTSQSLFNR